MQFFLNLVKTFMHYVSLCWANILINQFDVSVIGFRIFVEFVSLMSILTAGTVVARASIGFLGCLQFSFFHLFFISYPQNQRLLAATFVILSLIM